MNTPVENVSSEAQLVRASFAERINARFADLMFQFAIWGAFSISVAVARTIPPSLRLLTNLGLVGAYLYPKIMQVCSVRGSFGWWWQHMLIVTAADRKPAPWLRRLAWVLIRSVHYIVAIVMAVFFHDSMLDHPLQGFSGTWILIIFCSLLLAENYNQSTWYDRLAGVELVCPTADARRKQKDGRGFDVLPAQPVLPLDEESIEPK